ncbi:MAG: sugar phosphate isomerase/epimerase family protein [Cyclobacteriaceae bacterium]
MKYWLYVVLVNVCIQAALAQEKSPEIGIVENLSNDSLLYANGYLHLVESVGKIFSPRTVTDQQFDDILKRIKLLKVSLYAMNIFIPGELKVVGPKVDEATIIAYAEGVFKRCQLANVSLVVWGSGGSRRLPEGFDPVEARNQFITIARKVAGVAQRYQITLALENLNRTETNFITSLEEALDVVKQVDHPNFKLCADIYHMLKENEPFAVIKKTKGYLVHCDLAERENRTPPGVQGDDFREYLSVLKKIKYHGKIMLECRWNNLATQAGPARLYLQKQIDEVWKK